MVWRSVFIARIRAMEGATSLCDAHQTGSPITAWSFEQPPAYLRSATGNQSGATPGWPADGNMSCCGGNKGILCVNGWAHPGLLTRNSGWGSSGSPGSASASNSSGWGMAQSSTSASNNSSWGAS